MFSNELQQIVPIFKAIEHLSSEYGLDYKKMTSIMLDFLHYPQILYSVECQPFLKRTLGSCRIHLQIVPD
jgi:hypothetical protein